MILGFAASGVVALFLLPRLARRYQQVVTAIDNMSQGLGMFDASRRLILVNDQYRQMYNLSPHMAQPGSTLRQMFEYRSEVGTFSGDIDAYIEMVMGKLKDGNVNQSTLEMKDGRVYHVINRPMADGGWVSTHQDITERRRVDQERDALAAKEERRDCRRRCDRRIPSACREHAEDRQRQRRHDAFDGRHAVRRVEQDVAARRRRGAGLQ